MAAINVINSQSRCDTKNIKMKDSSDIPVVVTISRTTKKPVLMKDHDSLLYERGLQLSDEHLNEMKNETDVLNKADSTLRIKPSMSAAKILRTTTAEKIGISNITVKKEISFEEESLSTPMKSVTTLDLQAGKGNLNNTISRSQTSDENKKKCNNIIRLASKHLSDEERKILRAKRFNIIVAESCQNTEKDTATKVSTPACRSMPKSANHPTPTYDTLKKRAERFGENVSTVMKSLDYKEKMLKRKLKFLESVTNLKELEIKKKRAERFRMI